ncbi:PHD finger protein MALE STERILITY 1 [Malania oleifera]|uniref:PHD finger protein MALE STERILITY 1 n=1 Tax=Malania oleifera TaxID=397392 RepID=UPI0025AE3432|nr:PHD finger protein MALE STERILITY 1 [Malania oleifera]
MLSLDLSGCKKRKRGERVFRFKNFGEPGHPVEFDGPFRTNIKSLFECGHLESSLCSKMPSRSFQLEVHRHPPVYVLLFVIEESVDASFNRHCRHCKYVGWGNHMICNKKYHILVPSKDTIATYLNCEGDYNESNFTKDKYNLLVELQGHIMHGVFHSNGFGHLLSVNGLETGSELAGYQIIQFWDRLCTSLQARKVSLNDISQKRGMDLRLLHAVVYGKPWFGRWGYKFGRGSFGVTATMYQKAIEAIQGMPLNVLIHHIGTTYHGIPGIFSRYQKLSDFSLVTLRDLFHFIFELKSHLPKETCVNSWHPGILVDTTTCRWSPKRIEMATRAVVEALRRAEFKWVSRQEVRDTARMYIGDTGLLDFVLKSLGNHVVGNFLVRRSLNPVTKVLEYCLVDISNAFPKTTADECLVPDNTKVKTEYNITRVQLMKDLFYLYKSILRDQNQAQSTNIGTVIPVAARIILDTKFLIKEYCSGESPSRSEKGKEGVFCTVQLEREIKNATPPYECFILKDNATVGELELEVERTFREMYWGLRSFSVSSIKGLNAKGPDIVSEIVGLGDKLVFEGINTMNNQGIIVDKGVYESSENEYVVDCPCGASDDDGERMVSCDICEVRQHTRCVKIPSNEEIPHMFLCSRCEQDILLFPSLA